MLHNSIPRRECNNEQTITSASKRLIYRVTVAERAEELVKSTEIFEIILGFIRSVSDA